MEPSPSPPSASFEEVFDQLVGGGVGPPKNPPPAPPDDPAPVPRVRAPHRLASPRPARWVALAGWLVPGAGHALVGRPGAAFVLFLVIVATFAGGLTLTDFTCVNPRTYELEFVAHAMIGGPTALTLRLTRGRRLERMPPAIDVGRLFVVVAGLLNLVAICDAVGERWRANARLRALAARQAAPAAPPGAAPAVREGLA